LIKRMLIGPLSLRIPRWVWTPRTKQSFTPALGADGS
jgi:hypothetical protein